MLTWWLPTKPMASSDQLHLEVIFWLLSPSTKFPLRTFNMLVLMEFIFNLECIYIYVVLQNICFGNSKFWEFPMSAFPIQKPWSKPTAIFIMSGLKIVPFVGWWTTHSIRLVINQRLDLVHASNLSGAILAFQVQIHI